MDILDESFGTTTEPVELDSMIETFPMAPTGYPQSAVRNRSATAAILTAEPDKMVETYRLMMQEAQEGKEVTQQQALQALEERNRTKNMTHVLAILGDKTIPLEQKKSLMDFVKTDGFKEDPSTTLQTQALVADSKGEDKRGEAARISTADIMREMEEERVTRQKLVNNFMASLPGEVGAEFVGDMAATEVMPFGRNKIAADVAESINEKMGVPTSFGQWVKNFLLPGSTDRDIQKKLMSIPPEKRAEHTKLILSGIKDSAAIFGKDNHYAQFSKAVKLLDSPEHSDGAVWMENMMTVLDAFWVGSELRAAKVAMTGSKTAAEAASRARRPGSNDPGVSDADYVEKASWELVGDPYNPNQIPSGVKRLTGPEKVADTVKRIELNSVVRRENPATPYSIVEQVNPAKAREFHTAIMAGNDELAEALTGVNKEQALVNNTFPQVGTESGNVLYKVNQDVQDALLNTGATRYTASEFDQATAAITRDFRNATGLEINDAMTTFRVDGDHMIVEAHYATAGGHFVTPEAAREQAKYALKGYGVRDDEIIVMKREGMDYVPAEGATEPGDYIIKVKTTQPISDEQITNWNPLDVKRNFLDRVSQLGTEDKGNLTGWLFDPGSMLHPTLTGSASVATDQAINFENILLKPIKELRTELGTYGKDRMTKIENYLVEANTKGLKHDPYDLAVRGFTQEEIGSLKKWKDIWDGHHYLENFDVVRTLRSQNFQIFENANTKLFARPLLQKNQNIGKVYDPATDSVVNLTKSEMDALYNLGGYYATLRRPLDVSGVTVEHMIIRNTPSEYLRTLRDTDSVLNYRDGYYTINYKAPKFIDEISVDSSGKEIRRTVAVAGNTKDADMFIQSQTQATGNKHVMREDSRGFKKDGDGYWDLNESSGRIAQRMRGKPLVQATSTNILGHGSFVENPMESAVRAAKSLAGRTVSRPMLETAKKRFIEQYKDLLPPDNMGGVRYPVNRSEIVDHVSHTSSRVADARTQYGYINFLEDGYINSADQIFKGGMNVLADLLGKYHLSSAERASRFIGDMAPTNVAKGTVFQAYIAMSNPIRQWIVQSHQAGRMVAYNPVGFMNGGWVKLVSGYLQTASDLGTPSKAAKDFYKFVTDSGMVAGVDRNSLVRGLGLSMADSSSQWKRGVGAVASMPQTIGFDVGEKLNQLGHLAAVYEKWTRAGKNLADKTTRDLALTEARALSYDLNKAGELTYTQSTPAMILQFLQMPHKALLQATNRKLPLDVRLRLQAWDLVMFGAPTAAISALMFAAGEDGGDILPDDQEARDKILYGLEAWALNKAISLMDDSGEKTRIDFSALSPNSMDGWAKMYTVMLDDGVFGALAASPAGQLFAVNGVNNSRRTGRVPQAFLTMGRFFNVVDEMDEADPTKFVDVVSDVAKITSGWSAADKAILMLETRKKLDASGVVVDSTITKPEIYAQFLGFGTLSTKELYEISKNRATEKKKHDEEVLAKYRDITAYYAKALSADNVDVNHVQNVGSMLMRTFTDPYDRALVVSQWKKDILGKERGLFVQMVDASGMPNLDKMADDIRKAPFEDATKAQLMQRIKDFKQMREDNEEGK